MYFRINPINDSLLGYNIWGVTVSEVEVDILTGEMLVLRTDILQDAGLSTSPQVDKNEDFKEVLKKFLIVTD